MSVPVALDRLREEVARYGEHPFILTVSDSGRPHAVAATMAWDGDDLIGGCGRSTAAFAVARPDISLLWPPLEPDGPERVASWVRAVGAQAPSGIAAHRHHP